MDPVKNSPPARQTEGDDLGVLIYNSGKSLRNLSVSIGKGISKFSSAILLCLVFFTKNIWWLILGTIVGLGYGFYLLQKNGMNFHSEMTVKANFNSTTALYNAVDYVNALINTGQVKELASIFNIPESQAKNIRSVSATPVESEMTSSDLYKERYLKVNRGSVTRQDTFWLRALSYEKFKESLTKYDYPIHTISVVATNPTIFSKLQNGIIAYISGNRLLQQIKEKTANSNQQQQQLLESAIGKLDTLRRAYNDRLMKGQTATTPLGSQLSIVESSTSGKVPELELYDKMLELSDELNVVRNKAVTENEIVEVLSPFNPTGQRVSFLKQNITQYSALGFLTALVVLLAIAFNKYLRAFEKRHQSKIKMAQANTNL